MNSADTLATGNVSALSMALSLYLSDIESLRAICLEYNETAAIHTKGSILQIYRLFERSSEIASHLRTVTEHLPDWLASTSTSEQREYLAKTQRGIVARMKKHKKLLPILTKGVMWEEKPYLVHAYKFETDPIMKIELVVPTMQRHEPELPLKQVSDALRFHEVLVPRCLSTAKAPYTRHETDFDTITDYLSKHMPSGVYNAHIPTVNREGSS